MNRLLNVAGGSAAGVWKPALAFPVVRRREGVFSTVKRFVFFGAINRIILTVNTTLSGALAAAFALLAQGLVVIHQQDHYKALLGVQARRADFHAQMRHLYQLLQHPDELAETVMGGAQQKQLRASKLRAVAAPTHKLEESGEYAEENYLHSSFPTTNRKGLRKHIASVFIPHKSRAMRERESERESERARARESLVHNGSFPMRCHSSPGVRSA
jgi:hypothetical protein